MGNFFRGIIRASSFFRKEIFEILRQPRLVATLVLGPFLILFIFGIGYRSQSRALRTLFVVPPDSPIAAQDIQQIWEIDGLDADLCRGHRQPERSSRPAATGTSRPGHCGARGCHNTIKNNQQAVFTLYHHEIDPVQVNYINYLGWLYVGAVNQQVLRSFAVQGQKDAVNLHTNLQEAHQNVSAMRQAVQSGDETLAQQKQQGLASNVDAVSLAVGASLGLLDSLQQTKGANGDKTDPVQSTLTDLRQNTNQLSDSTRHQG